MALDQCASRIQPCSSVADIQSGAGPQSTVGASNADEQIPNESFQAESSASATTAALSMRSQIPQETVPEPSTAPENGSPVEPNIITDLASPSSRPLALPRDPVEVVQGGRTRAALGMRTMISHEGNHLSLRDAETWDWMMSVLHRVGVRDIQWSHPLDHCSNATATPCHQLTAYAEDDLRALQKTPLTPVLCCLASLICLLTSLMQRYHRVHDKPRNANLKVVSSADALDQFL